MYKKLISQFYQDTQEYLSSMFSIESNQQTFKFETTSKYQPCNDITVSITFYGAITGEFNLSVDSQNLEAL